jgi:transcription elongation GreA/GreB family factor
MARVEARRPSTDGADVGAAKEALKTELLATLEADLETLERAYRATRDAATHEEAKPENDKDTRALEQSYLARGQAARIEELRAAVAGVGGMSTGPCVHGRVALGALVTLEEGGDEKTILFALAGGGKHLREGSVQVVTPKSPLGASLLGKVAEDEVELRTAGKTRELRVVRVA